VTISEKQYEKITDEIESDDFSSLHDLATEADITGIYQELEELSTKSRRALDYKYDESTHDDLEDLLESVEEVSSVVTNAIEALEKMNDILSKAELTISTQLYADDFEDEI
jgi:hypothetical protein